MKETLELKHLAPYLPFGLKVIMEGKVCNIGWLSTKNICVVRPNSIGELKKINWKYANLNIKPILRPIEDFEKFDDVLNVLPSNCFFYLKESGIKWIETFPYEVVQVFLENHFDIFGLIDKGLAEPVTETFNPYK